MKQKKIFSLVIAFLIVFFWGVWRFVDRMEKSQMTQDFRAGDISATMYGAAGLEEKYWGAFRNCVSLLEEPEFGYQYIDFYKVSVDLLSDSDRSKVQMMDNKVKDYFSESKAEHWCFKIGTPDDCIIMVCNAETDEVVGYIE